MQEKLCADCAHFIQHYRKYHGEYTWINCGHCMALLIKKRPPGDKPCAHFLERAAEA